ncbi:MAG: hypothetical protein Q4C34_02725 [Bacteroidales bacterium]|nr:hypothetical protein [Bacteroidales bacterium]
MDEETKHRFTARIADVEPFVFSISLSEEPVFRRAAYHVNDLWRKMCAEQPGKSSHYVLAKVALAFAELYYRKAEQLASQSQMLADFETNIDRILLDME